MKLQTYRTYDAFNCKSSKGDEKHGNKTHPRKMTSQNYINHSFTQGTLPSRMTITVAKSEN